MKGRPAQPLNAAQQFMLLRANPLAPGRGVLTKGRFTWSFEARPSPIGRAYNLRVEFQQGDRPLIYVDGPDLHRLADGRRLPHCYEQRPVRLCLYFPHTGEWRSHMRIDNTIIPWAILWLFYFEEWLLTDEWKGGGMHPVVPADGQRPKKKSRRYAA